MRGSAKTPVALELLRSKGLHLGKLFVQKKTLAKQSAGPEDVVIKNKIQIVWATFGIRGVR